MRRGLGAGLVALGVFLGVGLIANLGGGHAWPKLLLAAGLFVVLPVAAGARLLLGDLGPRRAARLAADADRAWESELMRLAARRHGALSVAEVVAHADLDPVHAERILDGLCRRGLAEHRVTDDGQIIYRFESAPGAEQKRLARGVLDD